MTDVTGQADLSSKEARLPRPIGPPLLGWRLWKVSHRDPTADVEVVVALLGLLAFLMVGIAPLEWVVPWLGSCRFHELTGHPCPTCGITRGVLELADGRLLTGVRQNPLLIGALVAGLAYTPLAWWTWLARKPRWRLATTSRRARILWLIAGLAALVANWAFLILDGR